MFANTGLPCTETIDNVDHGQGLGQGQGQSGQGGQGDHWSGSKSVWKCLEMIYVFKFLSGTTDSLTRV